MFGDIWNAWASLFSSLPQGDPYIAMAVLAAIIGGIVIAVPKIIDHFDGDGEDREKIRQLDRAARCLNKG